MPASKRWRLAVVGFFWRSSTALFLMLRRRLIKNQRLSLSTAGKPRNHSRVLT